MCTMDMAGRDQSDVICVGDNPNLTSPTTMLQQSEYESCFSIDFQLGISFVPGYRNFCVKELDEHVQAVARRPAGGTHSQMLVVNLFSCNYRAKTALKRWSASQHGCDVAVFHQSYQAIHLCNCGQIAAGVAGVLQRGASSWPSSFHAFDTAVQAVAASCNADVANRGATSDLDLTKLISKKIGEDTRLHNGKVIALSFLEAIHLTTRWHKRLHEGAKPKPLCIIMNTDITPNESELGHWVVILLRQNGVPVPAVAPTDSEAMPNNSEPAVPPNISNRDIPDGSNNTVPNSSEPAVSPNISNRGVPDGSNNAVSNSSEPAVPPNISNRGVPGEYNNAVPNNSEPTVPPNISNRGVPDEYNNAVPNSSEPAAPPNISNRDILDDSNGAIPNSSD